MSEHHAKYGNKKTVLNGISFDSIAEAHRYQELCLLLAAGKIANLAVQPGYQLLPAFTDRFGTHHRAIVYRADFRYLEHGRPVAEDVKGAPETDVFKIKRKLFAHRYPDIELRIIGGER